MFTGLIESTAKVIDRTGSGLILARPASFDDMNVGSSISVSGACLTVVELTGSSMRFDVHEETWKRTKLGELKKGHLVNLERALKAGDRLEGHIVQGHIDSTGMVVGIAHPPSPRLRGAGGHVDGVALVSRPAQKEGILTITYPFSLRGFIVEKGSIAVDGVSLTVTHVDDETFSVVLIPETLKKTTLGNLEEGSSVNLEADILGKYARSGALKG